MEFSPPTNGIPTMNPSREYYPEIILLAGMLGPA
jgi:hypothetical protein